ncbi:MAG: cytochrome P450 [Gammaproteobacteria bacterium]|nr:cytochrome P450 [Gammaproteobacteria bacterium]|tara:strand:- start:2422 stop:3702 length:1281 start_codon:yes stop_codon:yes gene_type:complete
MSTQDVLTQPLDATTPLSPEVLACPHAYNARLRREAPVYRCPHTGIVFVSDYATVRTVAKDHRTFSNRFGQAMRSEGEVDPRIVEAQKTGYPPVDTMLTQDPPLHRRYRGMVNQAFTARRVSTLEPYIEALCHELIDGMADAGRCEFVADFAERVPMTVIADQLGVPLSDYELFKRWSDAFVAQLSRLATPDEELEAVKLIVEFQHYFADKLEARRTDPKDDIISDIVHARLDDERPLEVAEMLSILQQLLVAGNETTTHSIAEGVLLWIRHPDQLALLREDPDRVENFTEEVLRLASPTANMWRLATADTRLGDVDVPAGTMVQIRFSSANRDEAVFPEPDRLDVTRDNARSHLAFGHGVHMCIGASLARKEMNVAFRVLLERLDDLALDCDEAELTYAPNVLLRGLSALPLRFTVRPRGQSAPA